MIYMKKKKKKKSFDNKFTYLIVLIGKLIICLWSIDMDERDESEDLELKNKV